MLANYHTHTTRCNHATGTDREYVEEAIKAGMKVLGFSDHCPWDFPDPDYVAGLRMTPAQMDDYFDSILSLRKEYEKDITIYVGFEAEYLPPLMERQEKLYADYPVDYLILGQHNFGYDKGLVGWAGDPNVGDSELLTYINLCIEGMKSGKYKYLCHPDLLNYPYRDEHNEELYYKEYKRLLEYMKEADYPIELNMNGLVGGRHYPCDRFFRIAQEVGNKVIIGCDAHYPELLSNKDAAEHALDYASRYDLEIVNYLPGLGPKN